MILMLENGDIFKGKSCGHPIEANTVIGEVVFNTGMTGYQEVFTDPSYCDQIIVMTYPMIGNYGICNDDYESLTPSCKAVIAREFCEEPSHYKARKTIKDFLLRHKIPALGGIDTRKLVKTIRSQGSMKGVLAGDDVSEKALKGALESKLTTDQVARVSSKTAAHFPGSGPGVVMLDFGYKKNILTSLLKRGLDVVVVPWNADFETIKEHNPEGIMLTNGPGDPKEMEQTIPVIRELQKTFPLFAICMGHQVFAMANGAKTEKLKFGHRGVNHPVKDLRSGKVFITSQNHGYSVDPKSVKGDLEVTQTSLNDGTIEGLRHKTLSAFSVQYHPEASPGPSDTNPLFDEFLEMIKKGAN